MKYFMVILSLALLVPPSPAVARSNPLSHCGTERWRIKTLDDADAADVTSSAQSSIVALIGLPVPAGYNGNNDSHRYPPAEDTVYTVRALLVGFKEEADRDLHVVIADPAGGPVSPAALKSHSKTTMIAEVPDPQCSTVKAGGHATQIAHVRSSFEKCFGLPSASGKFKYFGGAMVVDVSGVGFFDKLHRQTGVAPNGIELHPVLHIKTVSGACPTGYSATSPSP